MGDYILFLNPDTILPEDFARSCLAFLQSDPRHRRSLRPDDRRQRPVPKESRSGFPSPWVAFCKLIRPDGPFPRSRRFFATYYLGHLPPDHAHPVPVLSGACLWVSRAVTG